MKHEIAGVTNENEKGRGVEGPDAADIPSHTLNLRSQCGKSHRLIHVPNDSLYRVTNHWIKTQQKISFPSQLNRGSY